MITISLCMIVKNEEDVIARVLESAAPAVDEIIIVDTGSTDKTKEIACRYTDKIYDFEWIDDFSAARNDAFSRANMDYILWLDADDVMTQENQQKLIELKETLDPAVSVVMMKYQMGFDEYDQPSLSYNRERLIKNHVGFQWQGAIHEAIPPAGQIVYSDIAVEHRKLRPSDPDRNLNIFEKMIADGNVLEPRAKFYYARELYYHQRYEDCMRVLGTFLEEGNGWIENNIDACRILSDCYQAVGQPKAALRALLRSFEYDEPRAEICCGIGKYFFDAEEYHKAVFWYQIALTRTPDENSGGFVSADCYGFIPYLQMCVCYSRMGQQKLAEECNQKAGTFKPYSPAYLYNLEYFKSLKNDFGTAGD